MPTDPPRLLRLTTVPLSLRMLLTGQPRYMATHGMFRVLMGSADGPERVLVVAAEGCPHEVIPFTRAITPLQDLRCLAALVSLMRRERPHIVHTHTPKAGLLGMLAARIAGVPVRIHTIAGLPYMTARGRRRQLLRRVEQLTYWGAQHVWPNSPSMLDFVRAERLCAPHKLDMVAGGSTNGIDLEEFSAAAVSEQRRAAARESIRHEAGRVYLTAIGRVVRDKGIPELIDVFVELQAARPELCLLLIGPLEEERSEETLATSTVETIRTHSAIRHVSWTDDVPAFLAISDLLVFPSHREGFPNVPLQAGAMECPIVCSAIPGNVDIVEDGVTGRLFAVGQRTALTAALRAALEAPEGNREMATALRRKIEDRFDRRVIHAELLRRYQALLQRRGR